MERVKAFAEKRREQDMKRKLEVETGQKDLVLLMPDLPTRFHDEILRRADEWARVTGQYPFNPRCLQPRSLLDIDLEFVTEYEDWRELVQYFYDYPDRPEGMT